MHASSTSRPQERRFYRAAGVGLQGFGMSGLLLLTWALAGCQPDAAATNRASPEDQFPANRVLGPAEEERTVRAMDATAAGEQGRPLVPAPAGYRWSDVPGALRAAAGVCFAGVASISQKEDEVVATLVLDDGQRGTATASRREGGVVLQVSLGIFGQPTREAEFTGAFERALRQMGAVRRPQGAQESPSNETGGGPGSGSSSGLGAGTGAEPAPTG